MLLSLRSFAHSELNWQRLRAERFGDDFGKATHMESSGIFDSGEDSLVVREGNDSEERARAEKERRGLVRKKKGKNSEKPAM